MLMGDICTRRCGFCAVPKCKPQPIDGGKPRRVAEAFATLGLNHAYGTIVKCYTVMVTKSGVMVGLGETTEELIEVFRDLGGRDVDILTVGQYLRPSRDHLPVARFYTPEEFNYLRDQALRFGFRHVESGPLV